MFVLDIYDRIKYTKAFGRPLETEPRKAQPQVRDFDSLNTHEKGASSVLLDGTFSIYDLKINELAIPLAIMRVSARKNIVETALAGQDLSVVEIIGFENYDIDIAGLVIDEQGFPQDAIEDLNLLFRKNEALTVECDFLRIFDIHYVVLKTFSVSPEVGNDNAIPFEFSAIADTPIELELRDGLLPQL